VQEAHIEKTPEGQVPAGGGWFILNLGEMAWETVPSLGIWRGFDAPDADPSQPGIGVHVHVLQPGEANGCYHAEAAILMFGSPDPRRKVEWIADETAARYGASVAKTTGRDTEAYGDLPQPVRVRPPRPFGS
jgi:hypothetical protein